MYDVITFDCYGTLIDWERGFTDAFIREGLAPHTERNRITALYHSVEPEIESSWKPYRDVLREMAIRVSSQLGHEINEERAAFLPDSLPSWTVFADTNDALVRLRDLGIQLGILSNIDDDLFAMTARQFAVELDPVVTAEQVRSYKPAHPHFIEARKQFDGRRWLHAAQSHFHDVVPARELGIPVAWINRKSEMPARGIAPDYDLTNLTELADLMASL